MKTKQLPSELGSRLAVVLPGFVGAAVIVRALAVYWGTDLVASLLMLLMGAGFAAGVAELLLRQARAFALAREVAGLPMQASESDIDKASPPLRAFLRARLEHAPAPAAHEGVTPYLVGLLVMLGLLGTLLGLFETLHGAGQALTASANVDALRTGLTGPMRGLTRSFGCSAAGVSASAMLGLAAVFTRRAEAAAWARAQAYAMGPLRELSPLRRQLDAISRLTQQGEALPRAASAIEQTVGQLHGLAERWESAHRATADAQQKALTDMVEKLGRELARSAADAGRAMCDSMTPLIQQLVTRTGQVAEKQLSASLAALDRDLAARREADDALRAAVREELSALQQRLEQQARAQAAEAAARLSSLEAALRSRAEQQAELLEQTRAQAQQHLASLESAARALSTQLEEEARVRREESSRLLGDLAKRLDEAAEQRAQEGREALQAIAALGQQLITEGSSREQLLAARWEELSRALDARAKAERDEDAARLVALRAELEAQNTALAEQWQALAQRVEDATRATRAEEEARIARLDQVARSLGEELTAVATSLQQELAARQERDRALSALNEQAMQRLTESARALDEALTRQELAVQELIERGGEQLSRLAENAQQGAREALERLVQLGEAQASRFAELEAQLQGVQAQHTKALGEELTAHAERLSQGLGGATEIVREAATLLKSSSVEMAAVAEMFHKSVEQQREAARAWMESLGELEAAVERAGRGAAADALGDQLASTQEVFARQLQFQRELFEQLRTLRGAGPMTPSTAGEHDVSA